MSTRLTKEATIIYSVQAVAQTARPSVSSTVLTPPPVERYPFSAGGSVAVDLGGGTITPSGYAGGVRTSTVVTPASEYSPPYRVTSETVMDLGWNAHGESAAVLFDDGQYDFVVRGGVGGARLSLTEASEYNGGLSYGRGPHGFRISGSVAQIWEQYGEPVDAPTLPAHTEARVYSIRVVSGTVSYLVDGEPWYESSVPATDYPKVLYAELYASYDFVELSGATNFEADQVVGTFQFDLPAVDVFFVDEVNFIRFELPEITVVWAESAYYGLEGFEFELPSIAARMGLDITQFVFDLPALTVGMLGGILDDLPITWQGMAFNFPAPVAWLSGAFTYSSIDFSLPELAARFAISGQRNQFGFNEESGGGMLLDFHLNTYFDDGFGDPGLYIIYQTLFLQDRITTDPIFHVEYLDTLTLDSDSLLTVFVICSDAIEDTLTLTDTVSFNAVLQALIQERLLFSGRTTTAELEAIQYAVNVASGALTTYRDFGFSGFYRQEGTTYAVRSDGVYILREGDDNGSTRDYSIDFGDQDFGTAAGKNVDSVYFGLDSDGTAYAKLTVDDGTTYTYEVVQTQPTARAIVGRGAHARRWGLRLDIVDASSVVLDKVEFSVAMAVRRRIP